MTIAAVFLAVLAVAGNVLIYGGMAVAKLRWDDPRSTDPSIASIHNLRGVGDRVWFGDQPTPTGYRELVEKVGLKRVVNLRTGGGTDPIGDDPGLLAQLGVEYVRVPVHDGHAPDEATVRRFLDAVATSTGPVYVHCGGGVGRSSVMEAAYRASKGEDPSVLDQLFLGPVSLEQAWFVAAVGPGRTTAGNGVVRTVSRVIDFPRAYFSWTARKLR